MSNLENSDEIEVMQQDDQVEETIDEVEEVETEQVEANETESEESDTEPEAPQKDWEAEAKKLQAILSRKSKPKATPAKPNSQEQSLTAMDTIALIEAKVTNKEDIEEVVAYAKFKNIPVSDALNSSTVKAILKEKGEYRQTAAATNTGSARRGNAKLSDDVILANASKGKLPDDPAELVNARFNRKK